MPRGLSSAERARLAQLHSDQSSLIDNSLSNTSTGNTRPDNVNVSTQARTGQTVDGNPLQTQTQTTPIVRTTTPIIPSVIDPIVTTPRTTTVDIAPITVSTPIIPNVVNPHTSLPVTTTPVRVNPFGPSNGNSSGIGQVVQQSRANQNTDRSQVGDPVTPNIGASVGPTNPTTPNIMDALTDNGLSNPNLTTGNPLVTRVDNTGVLDANTAITDMAGQQAGDISQLDTTGISMGGSTVTNDLTTAQTNALLTDPSLGMDYDKFKQQKMDQLALEQARAIEKQRQGLADIGNTGAANSSLTAAELENATTRANFESDLDAQIQEQKRTGITTALEQGRQLTASNRDSWIAETSARLQKLGIDESTANARANREADLLKASADNELKLYISENGLNADQTRLAENARQFDNEQQYRVWATNAGFTAQDIQMGWEANQAALNRSQQTQENSMQRGLEREVEAGRLTLAQAQLAENVSQFDTEQEFKAWALEQGWVESDIQRAWTSGENALSNENAFAMERMREQFANANMNFDTFAEFVANEALTPAQTAEFLRVVAGRGGFNVSGIMTETPSEVTTDPTTGRPIISPNSQINLLKNPDRFSEIVFDKDFSNNLMLSGLVKNVVGAGTSGGNLTRSTDNSAAITNSAATGNVGQIFVGPIGEYSNGETRFGAAINGASLSSGDPLAIGGRPYVITGITSVHTDSNIGTSNDGQINTYTLTDAETGKTLDWNPWNEGYDTMIQRLSTSRTV